LDNREAQRAYGRPGISRRKFLKLLALESTRLPTLKGLYEDDEVLEQVSVTAPVQRVAPEHPTAAGLAALLGHVARDGRKVNASLKGDMRVGQALKESETELQNLVNQA
jgi:multiple sugar transport system substrate-binding protein